MFIALGRRCQMTQQIVTNARSTVPDAAGGQNVFLQPTTSLYPEFT